MSPSLIAKIAKLEKDLNALKVELNKQTTDTKPKSIDDCETIEQLNKFTTTELKAWLKKNKINVKKVSEKHKQDFVKIVWENISSDSEYSSDEHSESESEESDESDEWEYYYA